MVGLTGELSSVVFNHISASILPPDGIQKKKKRICATRSHPPSLCPPGLAIRLHIWPLVLFSHAAIANHCKLKATQIHSPTVLAVRSPKWVFQSQNQGIGKAGSFWSLHWGNKFLAYSNFYKLPISRGLWPYNFKLCFSCHIFSNTDLLLLLTGNLWWRWAPEQSRIISPL